jgi:hypothetical protein
MFRGPMLHRRTTALTLALALGWLAIGYANVVRGVGRTGVEYRLWAFRHHCYSDVLSLASERYAAGAHPLPYLADRIEYPVVLGFVLWAASFAPGGLRGHFTATYLFLSACLFLALAALARTRGTAPWWLGTTPALVYYAGLNWDLLPIALLAVAVLAWETSRPAASGALAALGVSAKLFPAAFVPAVAGALAARPSPRAALRFGVALALGLLAVNLPVALAAPDAWRWFFVYNAARGAENSIWEALAVPKGPLLDVLGLAPVAAAAAFALVSAALAARRGGDAASAVRLGTALALVAWIATNKVYSPQYALYGFLAGALAAAPLGLFLALSAISVADFHLAFEVRARDWEPWFRDRLVEPGHVVRTLAWLVLAGWIARALWRCTRPASRDVA